MPPTLPTIEDALSRKDWSCVEVILRQALRQNDIATAQRIGAGIGDALNDAWGEAAKDTTLWDHRPLHTDCGGWKQGPGKSTRHASKPGRVYPTNNPGRRRGMPPTQRWLPFRAAVESILSPILNLRHIQHAARKVESASATEYPAFVNHHWYRPKGKRDKAKGSAIYKTLPLCDASWGLCVALVHALGLDTAEMIYKAFAKRQNRSAFAAWMRLWTRLVVWDGDDPVGSVQSLDRAALCLWLGDCLNLWGRATVEAGHVIDPPWVVTGEDGETVYGKPPDCLRGAVLTLIGNEKMRHRPGNTGIDVTKLRLWVSLGVPGEIKELNFVWWVMGEPTIQYTFTPFAPTRLDSSAPGAGESFYDWLGRQSGEGRAYWQTQGSGGPISFSQRMSERVNNRFQRLIEAMGVPLDLPEPITIENANAEQTRQLWEQVSAPPHDNTGITWSNSPSPNDTMNQLLNTVQSMRAAGLLEMQPVRTLPTVEDLMQMDRAPEPLGVGRMMMNAGMMIKSPRYDRVQITNLEGAPESLQAIRDRYRDYENMREVPDMIYPTDTAEYPAPDKPTGPDNNG